MLIGSRRLDWLLPSWLEDYDAFNQSADEGLSVIGLSTAINACFLSLCIVIFSVGRVFYPRTFSPKYYMLPETTPVPLSNDTPFGWIIELGKVDEDVIIDKGGYDILFFIRFYKLSFKIFAFFSIYSFGVLLPLNATGDDNNTLNRFEQWSMNNIPQNSWRLWFHLLGIFFLSLITVWFLDREFTIYAKHRHNYLRQRKPHIRTVMVQGIPSKLRSTVTLATYFETLYPEAVANVRLCQDLNHLDTLIQKRLDTVTLLERAIVIANRDGKRPTISVDGMLEDVDAIRYYSKILEDLNTAVQKEQDTADRLANYVDRVSGVDSVNIIEAFLEVTEIGAVGKLLKRRGSKLKYLPKGAQVHYYHATI